VHKQIEGATVWWGHTLSPRECTHKETGVGVQTHKEGDHTSLSECRAHPTSRDDGMHALREGHTSVWSESTQEDWEAHLGVGVRADPTNREGVHLKMGDIYAELIQVGGGGGMHIQRGGKPRGRIVERSPRTKRVHYEERRIVAMHSTLSFHGLEVCPLSLCAITSRGLGSALRRHRSRKRGKYLRRGRNLKGKREKR